MCWRMLLAENTHTWPLSLHLLQWVLCPWGLIAQFSSGSMVLMGSRFSYRCCRTARRPGGKWSCTGEHHSARTSSASWMSMRTSTRGGSVCSSSWSGESPLEHPQPCGVGGVMPKGEVSTFQHCCRGAMDRGEMESVSRRDASHGRGAALLGWRDDRSWVGSESF